MKTILVGDIGGSYTRLAIIEFDQQYIIKNSQRYLSKQYSSFYDILTHFLQDNHIQIHTLDAACFAAAGAIVDQQVNFTNLNWHVSVTELTNILKNQHIYLINDFAAIGYSIASLNNSDLTTIKTGNIKPDALQLVVGAGTGLGVTMLTATKNTMQLFPSEAGHMDFAPTTKLQNKLLDFLHQRYPHVSIERVLSGRGLENIYQFFDYTLNGNLPNAVSIDPHIAGKHVIEDGLNQSDQIAVRSLELFIEIYGATIGNLCLCCLPFGGVFIAGGIAPRLLAMLQSPTFHSALMNKGRMQSILNLINITVITNPNVGLLGAAAFSMKKLFN